MKSSFLLYFIYLLCCMPLIAEATDASVPASPTKLIFIHHSCGENWLADNNGGLGQVLMNNNYYVSDTNYGWGPNGIGDRTDIGHWWEWFNGPQHTTYMSALYSESEDHSYGRYSRLSEDPGGENEIIMFKSCFPNSYLEGSPDSSPNTGDNPLRGRDAYSEHMTVANAKGIYLDLLDYFSTRPDKLFIAITAPPLKESATDSSHAANARAFNNWLVNSWLADYEADNVAVFDFYNVLTSNNGDAHTNDAGEETGNHHRLWEGVIQHQQTDANNYSAYPSSDSHPTASGNQRATEEFVPLLNTYYNQWKDDNSDDSEDNAFNVSTTAELQSALTQAQDNGKNDVINLAEGTYNVTTMLTYTSSENNSLELVGAGRDTCILDGGSATQILSINTTQDDSDVRISNLTLQNGATIQNGGALNVEVQSADVVLQNCQIMDSKVTGEESVGGGAVCISETGTVTLQFCGFYRNLSESNVGGLYVGTLSGTGRITNCVFEDNSVNNTGGREYFGDAGGAMFYSDGASYGDISNNTFINNTASGGSNPDGGGLMTYQLGAGSSLTLDNNLFQDNTAGLGGGGCILRFNNTDNLVQVTDNTFEGNVTTTGSGAGVFLYINEAELTYSGNTHVNNIAQGEIEGRGGGAEINHKNGEGLITGNTFTSNQAGDNGGGLSVPCETTTMTITANIFNANTAANAGGGLSYSTVSGSLTLSRNTWYDNQASEGGGVYVYMDQNTAENILKNNILWNDAPNEIAAASASGPAELIMTYSDVEDGTGKTWFGTGCIEADPLFTDPSNGDFSLSWANAPVADDTKSPCIDAGDPSSPPDPDGSRADMGAVPYGVSPDDNNDTDDDGDSDSEDDSSGDGGSSGGCFIESLF
ncbi:MAG: right-handed parallel beta-helix repeat-containing protein [Desulfobacterales bacterium]